MHPIHFALLSTLLLAPTLALGGEVFGTTGPRNVWVVGPTGDFATIQQAIDASAHGDHILVEAGTYEECVDIALPPADPDSGEPAQIVLQSLDGAAETEIRCAGATPAVAIEATFATLDGFTITRADPGEGIVGTGAAVIVLGSEVIGGSSTVGAGCLDVTGLGLVSFDSTYTDCVGASGGAIRSEGITNTGTLALAGVQVVGADPAAGGAVHGVGVDLQIVDSIISGTLGGPGLSADLGDVSSPEARVLETEITASGGAGIETSVYTVVAYSSITSNGGRGVVTSYVDTDSQDGLDVSTIRSSEISGNAGGVAVSGPLRMIDVLVADNVVTGSGGGVVAEARLTTASCAFERNEATTGGGVWVTGDSWTSFGDSFADNVASADGGGAWTDAVSVGVHRGDFTANTAGGGGGGLVIDEPPTGLSTAGVTIDHRIRGTWFEANQASVGGGAWLTPDSVEVRDSAFMGNNAETGGGLAAVNYVNILDTHFLENKASAGAGIHWNGNNTWSLDVTRCRFEGNQATGTGGAMSAESGYVASYGSWFVGNHADNDGGALWLSGVQGSNVSFTQFCTNDASRNGGAVYLEQNTSTVTFQDTVWDENGAGEQGAALYQDGSSEALTQLWRSSVVGNVASASADPAAVFAPAVPAGSDAVASFDIQDSVFQDNGAVAVLHEGRIPSISGSDFALQDTPVLPAGYTCGLDGNWCEKPPNASYSLPHPNWVANGDCAGEYFNYGWHDPDFNPEPWAGISPTRSYYQDLDGDTVSFMAGDCAWLADQEPEGQRYPGNEEDPTNNIDDDCFLGAALDGDGDGYPRQPDGLSDCDDTNPDIHPGATDIPFDNIDQDCFEGDEQDPDGDLFEDDADCGPHDRSVGLLMPEVFYNDVDDNCSLPLSGVADDDDADRDGFDAEVSGGDDCDDFKPLTYPGADDPWYSGRDENCDGANDFDQDGDGYVVEGEHEQAGGTAPGAADCDDTDSDVHPGTTDPALDCDDDDDGIANEWERLAGTSPVAADSDGDGIDDGTEWGDDPAAPVDTDGDGTADVLDGDSDGDGLSDLREGAIDSDDDGVPDFQDDDDDGDGIPTNVETGGGDTTTDTDGDGVPDHLDLDADGDGSLDASESVDDSDGDGSPDFQDDGSDAEEAVAAPGEPGEYGFGCQTGPASPVALGWLLLPLLARRRKR